MGDKRTTPKVTSMEKIRALKALDVIHPEIADMLLTLEEDILSGLSAHERIAALEEAAKLFEGDNAFSFGGCSCYDRCGGPCWVCEVSESVVAAIRALKGE